MGFFENKKQFLILKFTSNVSWYTPHFHDLDPTREAKKNGLGIATSDLRLLWRSRWKQMEAVEAGFPQTEGHRRSWENHPKVISGAPKCDVNKLVNKSPMI